jgi:hypothetical protein
LTAIASSWDAQEHLSAVLPSGEAAPGEDSRSDGQSMSSLVLTNKACSLGVVKSSLSLHGIFEVWKLLAIEYA